jgi:hypothetical protein
MADAYGTLTFTKSQDCSYDPQALQSALNSLRWDNEGGFWEISPSSAGLVFCQQRVQYPTVHPETDDAYIFVSDEDGSYYEKTPTEMDENDWDDYYDIRTRELSLEELAAIFLPLIEQGRAVPLLIYGIPPAGGGARVPDPNLPGPSAPVVPASEGVHPW